MTKAPLKVAVVGLGHFSQFHLRAWSRIAETRLVGVADSDPRRADAVAREYGVPGFRALDALLSAGPVDILDIVAPPAAHAVLTREALGKVPLVICQKPFCGGPVPAREVARNAEGTGTTIVVHENFRFQPWYREIRAAIARGAVGEVLQACFRLRPGDGRGPDAYLDRQPAFREMERLLLFETGIHFIDLYRFLFGPVRSVYADIRQLNPAIRGEDAGFLLMGHSAGAESLFDGNRLLDHATDNPRRTMGEMLVEGTKGSLRLDGFGQVFLRPNGATAEKRVLGPNDDPEFGGGCVEALCRHVARHRLDGGPLENAVKDYLPVLDLCEAAYESARSGRRIEIPEGRG